MWSDGNNSFCLDKLQFVGIVWMANQGQKPDYMAFKPQICGYERCCELWAYKSVKFVISQKKHMLNKIHNAVNQWAKCVFNICLYMIILLYYNGSQIDESAT